MPLVLLLLALTLDFSAMFGDPTIGQVFSKYKLIGTIVISSIESNQSFTHNKPRAVTSYSPASTFKILNSLIALEENVANNKDELFIWDGTSRSVESWNQNHTLKSAFMASCVWCYQTLAEKIGPERYRKHLTAARFGSLDDSFNLTEFWLDGSLRISAVGQVDFMKRLIRRSLSYSATSYEELRNVMLREETSSFQLRAKTGWTGSIGWFVGYVETSDDTWIFALNADVEDLNLMVLLPDITKEILQTKGII
jgi:beta-lactamase class D